MMAGGLNDTMFGMAGAGDWTPRRAEPIRTPLRQPHCAHCGRRIHNPEDDKSCGGCGSREVVMK